MTVSDVHRILGTWAQKDVAWERDNIGLQVGDGGATVGTVCVSLDVTEAVIAEALKEEANLIISHHPLLFRPPRALTWGDEVARCVRELVKNEINLIAAHTNLDFTRGGTSFALAEALGLNDIEFLHQSYRVQKKIVTFVPQSHLDKLRAAMAGAGAGIIGEYDNCAFGVQGTGSFRGSASSQPAVGSQEQLELVAEVRLEMIAEAWNVSRIIDAMKAAHPYEEVAYDVYPLDNIHAGYGMGILGVLKRPMPVKGFLALVKSRLGTGRLRYAEGMSDTVHRVAACGGSGTELTDTAIARQADAFITADVKYHDFHHARGKILLIDAGHYETEHPVVQRVVDYLKQELKKHNSKIRVFGARTSTNPVSYS